MTSYRRFFLIGLVFFATTVLGWATSVSMNPIADAFVTTGASNNLRDNNYGATGILGTAASGKPQGEFQSVLKFDLAAARTTFDSQFGAGQWTIQSLTLQLTAAPSNNAILNTPSAGQFNISWMQNDSWVEGTGTPSAPTTDGITFNTLQSTFIGPGDEAVGTFSFDGSTSGAKTYSLTLTSGLTADALAGNVISFRTSAADSMSAICSTPEISAPPRVDRCLPSRQCLNQVRARWR